MPDGWLIAYTSTGGSQQASKITKGLFVLLIKKVVELYQTGSGVCMTKTETGALRLGRSWITNRTVHTYSHLPFSQHNEKLKKTEVLTLRIWLKNTTHMFPSCNWQMRMSTDRKDNSILKWKPGSDWESEKLIGLACRVEEVKKDKGREGLRGNEEGVFSLSLCNQSYAWFWVWSGLQCKASRDSQQGGNHLI